MAENDYLATRFFRDRSSAEREYDTLVARGYSANDINVIMTDEARRRHFDVGAPTELGNKALKELGSAAALARLREELSRRSPRQRPWRYPAWDCSSRDRLRPHSRGLALGPSPGEPSGHSWARASPKNASSSTRPG